MSAGNLAGLEDVKAWLGLQSSTDDLLLNRLIAAASRFVELWLSRTIAPTDYDEAWDGNGGIRAPFPNTPVTAVAALAIDGVAIQPAAGPTDPGYRFDESLLMLQGHRFHRGFRNVRVSYTAGFATVPADIAQACIEIAGLRYRERDRIGQSSKSLQGEVVSFIQKDIPDPVRAMLAPYRKVISL
mgnify:CR=1 FL=1